MTIYRCGGLNLTQRSDANSLLEISEWASNEVHDIDMKLFYTSHMHRFDLCPNPVRFRVRRFFPVPTDVLMRKWVKRTERDDGSIKIQRRFVVLPAYALEDVEETTRTLRTYFQENAFIAMANVAKYSAPIIGQHFRAALAHHDSLPVCPRLSLSFHAFRTTNCYQEGDVEKEFIGKFIVLWFCIRKWLCSRTQFQSIFGNHPKTRGRFYNRFIVHLWTRQARLRAS